MLVSGPSGCRQSEACGNYKILTDQNFTCLIRGETQCTNAACLHSAAAAVVVVVVVFFFYCSSC